MSPPLTPDAEEARRQLAEELSKPIYADPGSWLLDVWNRVLDWLSGGTQPSAGLSTGQLGGIVLVAVVLAAIIVWSTLGPLQRRRRTEKALFADDERSAGEVRADAVALAAAGDWTAAALAIFRAMIRTLAERGTIEEFGGMTAHEATDQAAVRLPDFADRLDVAAQLFDSLAYGRGTASAEQYQLLLALDTEVGTATPTQVAVVAAPVAVAVEAV